ncbi:lambda-exonuclease family protein [Clostridium sp. CCUG 7971]|uniref:YqaJ viral recombinase family nuclease n=1 Tax=Clostridium sp. CCUG 7971 TaxID=2811414 RepID=UPI001ABABFBD|nr:YqaJ viral recombinase family protein [Clostridium sp. CCUG 7971]MBO3445852.1 YqaJ viral recombinase family protein [Clostridium sp. CCUG 7971]
MRKYLDSYIAYETNNMSKDEWLEKRKCGIGGSDAASVLGLSPYKSSMSVYMDKIAQNYYADKEDINEEVNYRMELGNKLENFVASEFTLKTGKKVRNINGILKNDKYTFAIANIDRAVIGEKAFLECKVTNTYSKKLWQKEVPIHYQIQCHHYMAVTGATHCYVAVLIGNEEFVIHKLDRDKDLINQIMDLEKMFWDKCVIGGELPTPDGSDDYGEVLQYLYKDSIDEELILFEKEELLNRYDEVCGLIKDLDSEKKTIEQYLKLQMKDYEIAYLGDRKITWKKQTRSSLDSKRLKKEHPEIADKYMKTTTSRVFRI